MPALFRSERGGEGCVIEKARFSAEASCLIDGTIYGLMTCNFRFKIHFISRLARCVK